MNPQTRHPEPQTQTPPAPNRARLRRKPRTRRQHPFRPRVQTLEPRVVLSNAHAPAPDPQTPAQIEHAQQQLPAPIELLDSPELAAAFAAVALHYETEQPTLLEVYQRPLSRSVLSQLPLLPVLDWPGIADVLGATPEELQLLRASITPQTSVFDLAEIPAVAQRHAQLDAKTLLREFLDDFGAGFPLGHVGSPRFTAVFSLGMIPPEVTLGELAQLPPLQQLFSRIPAAAAAPFFGIDPRALQSLGVVFDPRGTFLDLLRNPALGQWADTTYAEFLDTFAPHLFQTIAGGDFALEQIPGTNLLNDLATLYALGRALGSNIAGDPDATAAKPPFSWDDPLVSLIVVAVGLEFAPPDMTMLELVSSPRMARYLDAVPARQFLALPDIDKIFGQPVSENLFPEFDWREPPASLSVLDLARAPRAAELLARLPLRQTLFSTIAFYAAPRAGSPGLLWPDGLVQPGALARFFGLALIPTDLRLLDFIRLPALERLLQLLPARDVVAALDIDPAALVVQQTPVPLDGNALQLFQHPVLARFFQDVKLGELFIALGIDPFANLPVTNPVAPPGTPNPPLLPGAEPFPLFRHRELMGGLWIVPNAPVNLAPSALTPLPLDDTPLALTFPAGNPDSRLLELGNVHEGRLRIQIRSQPNLRARVSLLTPEGRLLLQTETSTLNPDARLAAHVETGRLLLLVEALDPKTDANLEIRALRENASHPGAAAPLPATPFDIALADLDNDGVPDLVAANTLDASLTLAFNNPDGSVASTVRIPVGPAPALVRIADIDNDGLPDILVGDHRDHSLRVLANLGNGNFRQTASLPLPGGVADLAIADLDGDGFPDIAATSRADGALHVFRGRSPGIPPATAAIQPTGLANPKIAAADFDNDGKTDILLVDENARALLWRTGTSPANPFANTRVAPVVFPGIAQVRSIAAADFNLDGKTEILTAGPAGRTLDLWTLETNLQPRLLDSAHLQHEIVQPRIVDLNGDGRPDIVHALRGERGIVVRLAPKHGEPRLGEPRLAPSSAVAVAAAVADIDNDGRPDIALADPFQPAVHYLFGAGGARFLDLQPLERPLQPVEPLVLDLNNDAIPDVAAISWNSSEILVMLGAPRVGGVDPLVLPVGLAPAALRAVDLDNDGIPDLVNVNTLDHSVSVRVATPAGAYKPEIRIPVGQFPADLLVLDVDLDAIPDIVVANRGDGSLSVLRGDGRGAFLPPVHANGANDPRAIRAVDLDNDGRPDIVSLSADGRSVELWINDGNAAFRLQRAIRLSAPVDDVAVAPPPWPALPPNLVLRFADSALSFPLTLQPSDAEILAASIPEVPRAPRNPLLPRPQTRILDVDRDGTPDLLHLADDGQSLLLHPGTLQPDPRFQGLLRLEFQTPRTLELRFPVGGFHVDDHDRDGIPDIVATDLRLGDLAKFRLPPAAEQPALARRVPLARARMGVDVADFNLDGVPDIVVVDSRLGVAKIRLGAGDGRHLPEILVPVGERPVDVVAADLNRDGRPDLVVLDAARDGAVLRVLLGTGAARFGNTRSFPLPPNARPVEIRVADFNHDGLPDVMIPDTASRGLWFLDATPDASFLPPQLLPLPAPPTNTLVLDFDNNGDIEILVGVADANLPILVEENPAGGYRASTLANIAAVTRAALTSADADDLDGDGRVDVVAASFDAPLLFSIVRPNPADPFEFAFKATYVGPNPASVLLADFDRDGFPDAAVLSQAQREVWIYKNRGDGSFELRRRVPLDFNPVRQIAADLDGDGFPDLLVGDPNRDEVRVLLNRGQFDFVQPHSPDAPRALPLLLADFNGDGAPDVVQLDPGGRPVHRKARPERPGEFESPIPVDPSGQLLARDLRVVRDHRGAPLLAALDARTSLVHFFRPAPDGAFQPAFTLSYPGNPAARFLEIPSTRNPASNTVVLAQPAENRLLVLDLEPAKRPNPLVAVIPAGAEPVDLALRPAVPGLPPNLYALNARSADVDVLPVPENQLPARGIRIQTDRQFLAIDPANLEYPVSSPVQPARILLADVDNDGIEDLVVLHAATGTLLWHRATADGLHEPPRLLHQSRGLANPAAVAAADFNRDGLVDFAILHPDEGRVVVALNNGDGSFRAPRPAGFDAGRAPAAIVARDVDDDRIPDLLVANEFGDLLLLVGIGDGAFKSFERANRDVLIAAGTVEGEFLLLDQARDLLRVANDAGDTRFAQGRADGLVAPNAATLADLDNDGLPDLLVLNSGRNELLVYFARPGGGGEAYLPPLAFPVGSNPVAIAVADVDADGRPDVLVANAGSNDVSVLLASPPGTPWTLVDGPRLRAGRHPVQVLVLQTSEKSLPDILVLNEGSRDVHWFPAVGDGFFDDRNPRVLPAGEAPFRAFVGNFSGRPGLVVLGARGGLLHYPDLLDPAPEPVLIPLPGITPSAGFAADFGDDGFLDIAIVSANDGLVAFLVGSPDGPRLVWQETLDPGLRPTDLIVNTAPDGKLRVLVAAAGRDQTFNIVVTLPTPPVGQVRQNTANLPAPAPLSANNRNGAAADPANLTFGGIPPAATPPRVAPPVAAPALNPSNSASSVSVAAPAPPAQTYAFGAVVATITSPAPDLAYEATPRPPLARVVTLGDQQPAGITLLLDVGEDLPTPKPEKNQTPKNAHDNETPNRDPAAELLDSLITPQQYDQPPTTPPEPDGTPPIRSTATPSDFGQLLPEAEELPARAADPDFLDRSRTLDAPVILPDWDAIPETKFPPANSRPNVDTNPQAREVRQANLPSESPPDLDREPEPEPEPESEYRHEFELSADIPQPLRQILLIGAPLAAAATLAARRRPRSRQRARRLGQRRPTRP